MHSRRNGFWSMFEFPYDIYQLNPALYIRLNIDPVRMVLDCLEADKEFPGDLFIAQTVTYLHDNIGFS